MIFINFTLQIQYLVNKAKIAKAKKEREAAEAKLKAEKLKNETSSQSTKEEPKTDEKGKCIINTKATSLYMVMLLTRG